MKGRHNWKLYKHDPGAVRQVLLAELHGDYIGPGAIRQVAQEIATDVGRQVEIHKGRRSVDFSRPRTNPTLAHHGLATSARWHLITEQGNPVADIYPPIGTSTARVIAQRFADRLVTRIRILDNRNQPSALRDHPSETRRPHQTNPAGAPVVGEVWTTRAGGRCKILAVSPGRVQVLHMETGNREWIDRAEFLASYHLPRRRNPESGWRSYGPGKFDSMVDSFLWSATLDGGADEEVGESDTTGWFGLMVGDILDAAERGAKELGDQLTAAERAELQKTAAVILSEDSQGFVSVEYFETEAAAREKWKEIEDEIAGEEGTEDNPPRRRRRKITHRQALGMARKLVRHERESVRRHNPEGGGTGYAVTREGKRITYAEAEQLEREAVAAATPGTKIVAYLAGDRKHITTWTGAALLTVTHAQEKRTGGFGFRNTRWYIKAVDPQGRRWHGTSPGPQMFARMTMDKRQPKGNPRGGPADEDAARELELFIENDAQLYRQQTIPILMNLWRKMKRGVYDHEKAIKLWGYLVESGGKKYAREFSTSERDWTRIFSPATRRAVAESLASSGKAQLDNREFDWQAEPVRFRDLAIGEAFEFANPASSSMRGPWVKLTARTYRLRDPHGLLGESPVRVGTISVQVKRVQANPRQGSVREFIIYQSRSGSWVAEHTPTGEMGIGRTGGDAIDDLWVTMHSHDLTKLGAREFEDHVRKIAGPLMYRRPAGNPLPRGVDRRSIRSVGRGASRILVGCPTGHFHPRRRGRIKCDVGTRRVNRAGRPGRAAARRNPRELERAQRTFERWHEFPASRISRITGPPRVIPKTLVKLGEIHSVTYASDKYAGGPDNPSGKTILYEHETKRPRPVLASDPDGRHVHIVGGKMEITPDGLVN